MSTVASLYETFTRGDGAALTHFFLKSAVWLLAAWALHMSLCRWKIAWRLYLWRAAAIGLLVLPLLTLVESPVALRFAWFGKGLSPEHMESNETQMKPNAVGMPNLAPMASVPSQASWDVDPPAIIHNESADGAELESAPDRAQPGLLRWLNTLSAVAVVAGVWGLGVAGLLLRLMMGAWSARLLMKRSATVADGVSKQAKVIAASLGIRQRFQVREVSSSRLSSPVLYGVAQPVLLIPEDIVERADERELTAVLAHELAHLRGNDLRWNWPMRLCAILYWPNPLVWGMRRAHLSACECQADAVSARACGGEDVYSQILATIALRVHGRNCQPGLAMARRSQVLRRIERLPRTLKEKPVRRRFLVLVGACASAVALLLGTARVVGAEETPSATPTQSDAIVAKSSQSEPAAALSAQEAGFMFVRVVDENGNPLPSAKLKSEYSWKGPDPDFPVEPVEPGVFRVGFPEGAGSLPGALWLYAKSEGRVPMMAYWSPLDQDAVPQMFTFVMPPKTAIRGRVVDAQGQGIAKATVEVSISIRDWETGKAYPRVHDYPVKTNAEGYWQCDMIPPVVEDIDLLIKHLDYPPFMPTSSGSEMIAQLRAGSWVDTLRRGYTVSGQVIDPEGQPVAGAQVGKGLSKYMADGSWQVHETDAQGRFRFTQVAPDYNGEVQLTVIDPPFAPAMLQEKLTSDLDDVVIKLEPGNPVRIRVVDTEGKPVEGVLVSPSVWRGKQTLFGPAGQRRYTDAKGEWEWLWAPADEVEYGVYKEGYISQYRLEIGPSEDWQTITLKQAIRVTATVINAETGVLLPEFSVKVYTQLSRNVSNYWNPDENLNGLNGRFTLTLSDNTEEGYRVRVEAPGYVSQEQVVPLDGPSEVTLHYAMEPGKPITGRVLLPDGTPVANATVLLLSDEDNFVTVRNGYLNAIFSKPKDTTNVEGGFEFPAQADNYRLLVVADAGCAVVERTEFEKSSSIPLRLWARVSGTISTNDGPGSGQLMGLNTWTGGNGIMFSNDAESDAQGHYRFERVAGGEYLLIHSVPTGPRSWTTSGLGFSVRVPDGGNVTANYDARGMVVTGKIDLKALGAGYHWNDNQGTFNWVGEQDFGSIGGALPEKVRLNYAVVFQPDGTFRIDGVLPGDYTLNIQLGDMTPNAIMDRTITAAMPKPLEVSVPPGKYGTVIDIGTVEMVPATSTVTEAHP